MYKYLSLLIIFVLFIGIGCAKTSYTVSPSIQHNPEAEEYAVYNILINSMYVDPYHSQIKLIVIEDHTRVFAMGSDEMTKILEHVSKRMPALEKETILNFQAKNDKKYPLKNLFNLKVKYVLISKEETDKIFKNLKHWDAFYKKYPGAQGIMTLSRTGFNRKMNQALIYMGNMSHSKAGGGGYFLLVKKNGKWIIQKEVMVWVS